MASAPTSRWYVLRMSLSLVVSRLNSGCVQVYLSWSCDHPEWYSVDDACAVCPKVQPFLDTVAGLVTGAKKERKRMREPPAPSPDSDTESSQSQEGAPLPNRGPGMLAADIAACASSGKYEAQAMAAARTARPAILEDSCVPARIRHMLEHRPNMAAVISAVPGHTHPFSATPPLQRQWYRLLSLATRDHDWNLAHRQRAPLPCLSIVYNCVSIPATSVLFPNIGPYRAWHILRSLRAATGCLPYPMYTWPSMSANTRDAAAALAECGIRSPHSLHAHLSSALSPELAAPVACGLAAELVLCSAHSAWNSRGRAGRLDLSMLAAAGVTGHVAMQHWAHERRLAGQDPEHDVGGSLVDARALLELVCNASRAPQNWRAVVARATQPARLPFLQYLVSLMEHGWLPKAHLHDCPDIIACHCMYTMARHRGWAHRDAVRWTVAAHELWYPTRAMAALAHVPCVKKKG